MFLLARCLCRAATPRFSSRPHANGEETHKAAVECKHTMGSVKVGFLLIAIQSYEAWRVLWRHGLSRYAPPHCSMCYGYAPTAMHCHDAFEVEAALATFSHSPPERHLCPSCADLAALRRAVCRPPSPAARRHGRCRPPDPAEQSVPLRSTWPPASRRPGML